MGVVFGPGVKISNGGTLSINLKLQPPSINTATVVSTTSTSVSFATPCTPGHPRPSSYTVTSHPGCITATGPTSPIVVSGLTSGQSYTFSVSSSHLFDTSNASIASPSVTQISVPGAPTIGTVSTASGTSVNVAFTAPANNGGATITSYRATSSPGGFSNTGTTSPILVTGLTAGTAYTFTVLATNLAGNSAASGASNSIAPDVVPGAPTIGTATLSGSSGASLTFTAPTANGGSAVTSYKATSSPGGITSTLTQSGSGTITISGLTANTSYTFTVTAINTAGAGSASSSSNSITTPPPTGSQSYTSAGSYTWVAPAGVSSVSVLTIGTGGNGNNCATYHYRGGSGGSLAYQNNIPVTAGNSYTVYIPATTNCYINSYGYCASCVYTYFKNIQTVAAMPGLTSYGRTTCCGIQASNAYSRCWVQVGTRGVDWGAGLGGAVATARYCGSLNYYSGGGGAGGFCSVGGTGESTHQYTTCSGWVTAQAAGGGGAGNGAGAGGWGGYGGGGIGLFGQGTAGSGRGGGGSGGANGGQSQGGSGGAYGGGGGGGGTNNGASGAVRIVWPGNTRKFPSTCVGTP